MRASNSKLPEWLRDLGSGIRSSFEVVRVPVRVTIPSWNMQVEVPRHVARDAKAVRQIATDRMIERMNELHQHDPEAFSVYVKGPGEV